MLMYPDMHLLAPIYSSLLYFPYTPYNHALMWYPCSIWMFFDFLSNISSPYCIGWSLGVYNLNSIMIALLDTCKWTRALFNHLWIEMTLEEKIADLWTQHQDMSIGVVLVFLWNLLIPLWVNTGQCNSNDKNTSVWDKVIQSYKLHWPTLKNKRLHI